MTDLRLALYQPDIPGNTGTILRLAACLGFAVDLIEPAGFDVSDRNLKRSGMDYIAAAALTRHVSWDRFEAWRATAGRRLILASTKLRIAIPTSPSILMTSCFSGAKAPACRTTFMREPTPGS